MYFDKIGKNSPKILLIFYCAHITKNYFFEKNLIKYAFNLYN